MAFAWDPFREMQTLRRQIDRLFDGAWREPGGAFGRTARAWPAMNLDESNDQIVVEALTPGLDAESLKVSVAGDQLRIEGRRVPVEAKAEAWHRNERLTGSFTRVIQLPSMVQPDRIGAEYKHGLLTITLPKAEEARPRQISVNVA